MQYIKKVKYRSIVHEMSERSVLCCDVAGHLVREEHECGAAGSVTNNLCIVTLPQSWHLSEYKTILENKKNIKHYINPKTMSKTDI